MRRRLSDLSEANRKIAEYENKIALLTQEIDRLNGNLRMKSEEVVTWETRGREWESRTR